MTTATMPEKNLQLDHTPLKESTHCPAHLHRGIINRNPGAWFETQGFIIDKNKDLVHPVANRLQQLEFEAIKWCLDNGVPIRIIKLKPRQKGSTHH